MTTRNTFLKAVQRVEIKKRPPESTPIERAIFALEESSAVMKEVENMIAELGLHDLWHERDIPHRSFHKFPSVRARNTEAIKLLGGSHD